ncbi:MAG: imidazole glycerol phosphate synthase subunit HisH [Oscillospiraceae bacterium]|nr:imidazole glycerol phosphate synthase subunit HisH [Oscillospiraceae bacterium]
MIAIVDYGVGNLFSLERSFDAIGVAVEITSDPEKLRAAEKILLPGVGAFGDAAEKLRATGLDKVVIEQARKGKPLMGICLGMQLLFDKSLEYGCHKGLGLIPGRVVPIQQVIPEGLKIPHMGWNALDFRKESPLFSNIKDGDFVYFVHSYCAVDCDDALIATSEYGAPVTAAVQKGNVFGCQFHPEKSGTVGLNILRAFAEVSL